MPASSSKRMTPARKKAKLDHNDVADDEQISNPTQTPSHKDATASQAADTTIAGGSSGHAEDEATVGTPVFQGEPSTANTPQSSTRRPSRSAKLKARAKLGEAFAASDSNLEIEVVSNHGQDAASVEASASTPTPTPTRVGKKKAATLREATSSTSLPQGDFPHIDDPESSFMPASAQAQPTTPASTSKRTARSAKGKAKTRFEDEDYDEDAASAFEPDDPIPPPQIASISTPIKTPVRPARSAKGKSKAKLEDDDLEEEEDLIYGKNPDLEIYSQEGPLSKLTRFELKTNKPRSLRPLWIQGVYHPPFFGIPTSDLIDSVDNVNTEDDGVRDEQSVEKALPWPNDGHVQTWLDHNAYPRIKRGLLNFWFGQVGWIPNEGIYDWGWFPGKAHGWGPSRERSDWARKVRKHRRQESGSFEESSAQGDLPGWPFVQPWLDSHSHGLRNLSIEEAQVFLQDSSTRQRSDLRHPTTVMKLTVPELSMRNRLKKSVVSSTPKSAKKASRARANGGDADAGGAVGDDEDEEAAADDDENAIAALDANQEPVNLDDPKFANIPNLGFEEKGPICGDVLHVSIGPPDRETPVQIPRGTSRRLDSLGVVPDEGHILNAGGHVYALDWAPIPIHLNTGKEYFAVSAAASKAPLTFIGKKQQAPAPASVQIWSLSPDAPASGSDGFSKGETRLEMVICHEAGAAFKLAWCPMGHDYAEEDGKESGKEDRLRRLGLLAGCFADGSISTFSVPHPDSVRAGDTAKPSSDGVMYIHLDPILRLEHPQQAATALAWAGGEMLAFGGSHGWLGVWSVGRILRESKSNGGPVPPPDYVVRAHRSSITDLTFILLPPIDADGIARTSSSPTTLFSVSLDGLTSYIDLHRSSSTSIERSRTVHYACAFSPFSGGSLVHEQADGSVAHYSLRPEEMLRSRQISFAPARVLSLSCSAFHPMLAMATAHGEVKVANTLRTLRRSQRNHLAIFQTILNRSTGELTVRHHLQPVIANVAENKRFHIAQWHPALAVTAVRWNPNLGRCRLLLSGTAAGMVKVDFVKPPYESS